MREAKVDTDWGAPDEAHEDAVAAFIDGLYSSSAFIADLEAFADHLAPLGEASALGQTLLKLTSPGVPDLYQGDELWDLALVDPDNRRPVDFDLRARLLAEVAGGAAPRRETAKTFLIHRALGLRARRPEAFAGDYTPLDAGARAFAYARGGAVIAATPIAEGGAAGVVRIPAGLRGEWRSALSGQAMDLGGEITVGELAGAFPVALLERT